MFNSILGRTRRPDITFSRQGRVELSARLSKLLSLAPRDVVDILHDNRNGECYIYCKHRSNGACHEAQVFPTNHNGNHFRLHSVKLCRAVFSLFPTYKDYKLSLPTAEEITNINGHDAVQIINLPL